MKKSVFALSIFILAGCGYDGGYRYECQDPQNWESEQCNPPLCLVDGNCTEALLGFDPEAPETTVETIPVDTTQETVAP